MIEGELTSVQAIIRMLIYAVFLLVGIPLIIKLYNKIRWWK